MTEKEQQLPYSTAPVNNHHRSDTEAATAVDARELRKKKRTKCLLYIVLFVIFQTGIIAIFGLTIMKIRAPKFRVRSAELTNFNMGTPESPSWSGTMNAEFSVKNANFGRYKYRNTTVNFLYRGTPFGQAFVRNSRAGWRSTKKFNVVVDLSLANPELASDISAGVVPITINAQMRGRVELMFVMKKNRSTNMNCSMQIVTATQQLRNIFCK